MKYAPKANFILYTQDVKSSPSTLDMFPDLPKADAASYGEAMAVIAEMVQSARIDPAALADWYATHLGVDPVPESYGDQSWWQQAGPTVFAPMPADSEHVGDAAHTWAVNFRVTDLAAMVDQLRGAGIEVEVEGVQGTGWWWCVISRGRGCWRWRERLRDSWEACTADGGCVSSGG